MTEASNYASHAEGQNTIANGAASHAEGYYALTSGNYSHAEGAQTKTYGLYSHAEGSGSIAFGTGSHAGGFFTIASGSGQTAIGKYNKYNNTDSLFVIGNGTSESNRSDLALFNQNDITFKNNFIVTGSATITGTSNFGGNQTISADIIVSTGNKIYIANEIGLTPTAGISSYSDPITQITSQGNFNGETIKGTAGENLEPGQIVYLNTDGLWYKANATSDDFSASNLLGITVTENPITQNDVITVLLQGHIYTTSVDTTDVPGKPIWLRAAAGQMTVTKPSGTGNVIRQVGHVLANNAIRFNPDNYYFVK